jgi:type VI secretion system protein ImpB
MAQASSQHKLDRVRPPRVHITYDVEIGNAIEIKSLPFQLGILGDFTGMPEEPLARLRDRSFVEVNPDNFDSVLEGMKPHLALTVENRLAERAGAPALRVSLRFKALEDFEPENVARQVAPLRELLDLRLKLNDLLGKLQGNDKLEELLTDAITNPDKLKKLESEIRASDIPVVELPVAMEAISVEPPAAEEIPQPELADSDAVIPTSGDVEVEAETVAAPVEATEPIEAPAEEAVGPTVEAAAAEPAKESGDADQVHVTEGKTE